MNSELLKVKNNLSNIIQLKINTVEKIFHLFSQEFDKFLNKDKIPCKYHGKRKYSYIKLFIIKCEYFNFKTLNVEDIDEEDMRMILCLTTSERYSDLVNNDKKTLVGKMNDISINKSFSNTCFQNKEILYNISRSYKKYKDEYYITKDEKNAKLLSIYN